MSTSIFITVLLTGIVITLTQSFLMGFVAFATFLALDIIVFK